MNRLNEIRPHSEGELEEWCNGTFELPELMPWLEAADVGQNGTGIDLFGWLAEVSSDSGRYQDRDRELYEALTNVLVKAAGISGGKWDGDLTDFNDLNPPALVAMTWNRALCFQLGYTDEAGDWK